ncbi:MAG: hypothetical protein WC412_05260 [Candidatus Omnitrophota bacterium]|jgi:vacuolar-type H+-ATPase subunit H
MKEIVDQILKEEETGRAIIEKTKKDAQDLILKAKSDAKELLNKTVADIKNTASQRQKEAENKFLAERENVLKETQSVNSALRESREKDIAVISKEVFLKIIDIKS